MEQIIKYVFRKRKNGYTQSQRGGQTITVLLSSGITFDTNSDQLIFNSNWQVITVQMISSSRMLVLNNFNDVDYTSGGA